MKKQKIVTIAAVVLIAGTALAETPVGEAVSSAIDEGFEVILDFREVPGDDEEAIISEEIILVGEGEEIQEDLIQEEVMEDIDSLEQIEEEKHISDDVEIQAIISGKTVDLRTELCELKLGLEDKGYSNDKIEENLIKFALAVNEYSLDKSERELLLLALTMKEDTDLVYDAFGFLKMTPFGADAIDDIYNMIECDGMSIEEAYAVFSGKEDEELSVDDIAYYVANGVSTDDILALYEISLGCDLGVRTMLDNYIEGDSWNKITANAYNIDGNFANWDYSLRTILFGIASARELNISFSELAASSTANEILSESYIEEINAKRELSDGYRDKINLFTGYELGLESGDSDPLFIEGEKLSEVKGYTYQQETEENEILEIPRQEAEVGIEEN